MFSILSDAFMPNYLHEGTELAEYLDSSLGDVLDM